MLSGKAPLFARLGTFVRSLISGSAATLVDLAVLAFAVGFFHASPKAANLPALFAGAAVQFFANRHFAFRAASGPLGRHALAFIAVEMVTLIFNAALYHGVASCVLLTPAAAVIARIITTNLVFVLWSYPMWKRVFQPTAPPFSGSTARR